MQEPTISQLGLGLNLNSTLSQLKSGQWVYSLNALIEGFDGQSVTIQNEEGNVLCTNFPVGYKVIGTHNVIEKNIIIVFLATPDNLNSEIGYIDTTTCTYTKSVNDPCLGFRTDKPILKAVHRNTPSGTEVYWTDGNMPRRYMDVFNPPYKEMQGPECQNIVTTELDCNKLNIQPNFSIPFLSIEEVESDGELEAGTYQFGIQYTNALGEAYTSVYSITNPQGIFDRTKITEDFNYKVNASIKVEITNIDTTGLYDYFNLVVVKAVNNILTPYVVGTYRITTPTQTVVYTGQNQTEIPLSLFDVTEKYPIYKTADDLTAVQDILVWKGLTTEERISYQKIASQIQLKWVTHRVKYDKVTPEELYALRGYMRDEVYPLELVPLLKNGAQLDGFHIPSRIATASDLAPVDNSDDVISDSNPCEEDTAIPPKWKVYNTATNLGFTEEWMASNKDECYTGTYEYGDFAYWESLEKYPCNKDIWGDLADTPIRHHKFPDSLITEIHDAAGYIYPIGIQIDVEQVKNLILASDLTQDQKDNIAGFKIVRGNRATNKSVVAKGLIHNVLKYSARDNQIDYTEGSNSSTPVNENPVLRLIDRAISLTQSAANAGSVLESPTLQLAVEDMKNAKLQVIGSSAFYSYLDAAKAKINFVLGFSDNERVVAYAQGALEILEAIPGVVDAFNAAESAEENTQFVNNNGYLYYPNYLFNDVRNSDPFLDETIVDESSLSRYTFHSPDTSFYQPSIGSILKLETAESGFSSSHIVQVKDHAKYQFVSSLAYISALLSGVAIGFASGTYGLSTNVFNGTAAMTAYQAILDIIFKITPHKNFAYQYNAVGDYFITKPVPNNGQKQRRIDISRYLVSGVEDVGDNYRVNNFQRESSVYLKTASPLPYVHTVSQIQDISKTLIPSYDIYDWPISSYYASIKKSFPSQYGQMYSYETIDTGFQHVMSLTSVYPKASIFGGDIFINKFAYKSKIPFFIDNRVGAPNDSDVFYNELSNVGKVKYWFSTDAIEQSSVISSLFGVKAHNFYWNRSTFFNDAGSIFLFAYGIPNFFCESEVNVDFRQAFNNKAGDFYPRVDTGIPDEWLQETNVSIQNDNSYYYNKTYSRQNQQTNSFSHLPEDYAQFDRTALLYRAIFSEQQEDITNYRRNNWLIYRPAAKYDFPQNFGKLTSVDGIEDRQVLARFENKTLLYNALLTAPTSAAAVYLGQSLFSSQVPPIDFADTDLGFVGTQHKMLLKTENGHIAVDAKRGQIFLIQGQKLKELSNDNVSQFLLEFLPFQIKQAFPEYDIDNNFNGCGLHGVYDPKYKRFILTKIDYKPLSTNIVYSNGIFTIDGTQIELTDTRYFCNYSFTISYSFKIQNWVSFHSYIPNYYVGNSEWFYSGNNLSTSSLWKHNSTFTLFNNFYGTLQPYIIEHPLSYKGSEEILQDVRDYTKVLKYTDYQTFVETNDFYFSHAILYNNQQCSGTLKLTKRPQNNLSTATKYPIYNATEKEILFTKSNSFYQFNTFWALQKTSQEPIWKKSCESISIYKELNDSNMNYSKRAFNKAPLMAKFCQIRLINKVYDNLRYVSEFLISTSQTSFR